MVKIADFAIIRSLVRPAGLIVRVNAAEQVLRSN